MAQVGLMEGGWYKAMGFLEGFSMGYVYTVNWKSSQSEGV